MVVDKNLPDKWIRKALYNVLNDIVVDGITIPCFDSRASVVGSPSFYILLSTQSNGLTQNKCETYYDGTSILIDCITVYDRPGNIGSRLLADNIMDAVRGLTQSIVLDVASGLTVLDLDQIFLPDLTNTTDTEIVYRKLMRLEFKIT